MMYSINADESKDNWRKCNVKRIFNELKGLNSLWTNLSIILYNKNKISEHEDKINKNLQSH